MNSVYELKTSAKNKIREKINKILWCTLGYILFDYIMQMLILNLSGYVTYFEQYYNAIQKAGYDANAVYELLESGALNNITWPEITPVAMVLIAAIIIMSVLLNAGYEKFCLMISRKEDIRFKSMFEVFNQTGKAIIICLLRTFLTTLGFIFFIAPGFIIMYQYRLAVLIMYDNPETGALECLKQSRTLMRGHKSELFIIELSFIGWIIVNYIVSALFAPVIQLWLLPYIGVTRSEFYNGLIGRVYDAPENEPME